MVLHIPSSASNRDRFYIGFFFLHVISTIATFSLSYPKHFGWNPSTVFSSVIIFLVIRDQVFANLNRSILNVPIIMPDYTLQTKDPLMLGALSDRPEFFWFRWFLLHEGIFLLPTLCFGIHGLLKGTPSIYPTLLAYGAAASTTTATCLVVLLFGDHHIPLTHSQLIVLLSAYVPFFLVPLAILVDMLHRVHLLIDSNSPKLKTN